jgi:hypothetical protein
MKKNTRQPRTRLQSLDAAELAQVTGGATAQEITIRTGWVSLSTDYSLDSALSKFFFAAATA